MNEWWHTYDWVMSYIDEWYSCVPRDSIMCVTWLTHVCDMTHSCVWHDSFICVTWLTHIWHDSLIRDMMYMRLVTAWCVWHDSFICVIWRWNLKSPHMYHVTHMNVSSHINMALLAYKRDQWDFYTSRKQDRWDLSVSLDLIMCVTWLIHSCDSETWEVFISKSEFTVHRLQPVTWLVHTCDMTHSYVWHDSFICATWLATWLWCVCVCVCVRVCVDHDPMTPTCDMTRSYVWHDSFICVPWLVYLCEWLRPRSTDSNLWYDSFILLTWLRSRSTALYNWGKFSTHLSPFGRIRQVQHTTSCHNFGTINLNSIGISTVPGSTVLTKMFSTN